MTSLRCDEFHDGLYSLLPVREGKGWDMLAIAQRYRDVARHTVMYKTRHPYLSTSIRGVL